MIQNFYGCKDYNADEYRKIDKIVNIIREQSRLLNIKEMDTPAIEYTDLLLNKYGEEAESKLIFNLGEHGLGKISGSLRYDMTVPLVRFMAQNRLTFIRRLQIGKVFRRDKPTPESGRLCEFYQADCDIVGEYESVTSEVELIWLIKTVLENLGIDGYDIRYNYRQNLVSMCGKIGVKGKGVKDVCASIDKLDKMSWKDVSVELRERRGLSDKQIFKLREMIDSEYMAEEMVDFDEKFVRLSGCDKLLFTASLARGLDYYTGLIYEVVVRDSGVKTVIAGGRYDRLMYFMSKSGQKRYLPAIGVSFGVSRLCMLLDDVACRCGEGDVYIVSADLDMRIKLCEMFRDKGFIVDYEVNKRKIIKSITYAVKNDFKYCVIYGESGENVKVKELFNRDADKVYTLDELRITKFD